MTEGRRVGSDKLVRDPDTEGGSVGRIRVTGQLWRPGCVDSRPLAGPGRFFWKRRSHSSGS